MIQISLTNLSSNRCGDALHWWSRSLWFFRTVVFFTKILNNGAIVVSSIRYFSERTRKDISMEMSRWVNLHMIIIVIEYFCDLGSTGGGINIPNYQSIFRYFGAMWQGMFPIFHFCVCSKMSQLLTSLICVLVCQWRTPIKLKVRSMHIINHSGAPKIMSFIEKVK